MDTMTVKRWDLIRALIILQRKYVENFCSFHGESWIHVLSSLKILIAAWSVTVASEVNLNEKLI